MILLFKSFLLAAVLWIGYLFFFRVQSRLLNRVFVLLLGASVVVFVLAPDFSTRVAHWFGIGRGTDFILYLSQIFLYLLIVLQYLRIQTLQAELTQLVRTQAIREALPPKQAL